MKVIQLRTPKLGLIDITKEVSAVVAESGTERGICQVFVPHTTAGVTINENADPDVIHDMLEAFEKMVPKLKYLHYEGNSAAHIKASLVGSSATVPINNGKLYLGTWQGIYFCEFDGPRQRSVCINILG